MPVAALEGLNLEWEHLDDPPGISDSLLSKWREDALLAFGRELERFLEQALPVMSAAQSDAGLRDSLAAHMVANDLGPHRGVQTLGAHLAAGQRAGTVRSDVDPEAAATLFVSSCLLRVAQRQFIGRSGGTPVPSLERTVAAFEAMVRP